ncbi:MAG: Methyl-accepting chemotaxis protein II [Firmicutes bacterium ADurb.Bin193]|nr:MAG: Methyl-accepting chemotaxis protein II [Firmicutes bacterium ADurb.Bin193]
MIKLLGRIKISLKLTICFILIGMIGAVGGIVGVIVRERIIANDLLLYSQSTMPLSYLGSISSDFFELHNEVRGLLSSDGEAFARKVQSIKKQQSEINSYLSKLDETNKNSSETAHLKQLLDDYNNSVKKATDFNSLARTEQTTLLFTDINTAAEAVNTEIAGLISEKTTLANNTLEATNDLAESGSGLMFAVVFLGILMVFALGYTVSKSITVPLNKMLKVANSVSNGELDVDLDVDATDEVGILADAFRQIIASLKNLSDDTNMLVNSALEGILSARADASKHSGEYRAIVEGINNTLKAMVEPINEAAFVLKEMSRGNLTYRLEGDYKGDHAEIKDTLNRTLDALSAYISEINNASEQVLLSSQSVANGSQSLSQGATEQASSIEELTTSIAQIAEQTKENAGNAARASEMAQSVKNNAEQGNEYMKEMLVSMNEIDSAAANIYKVIKVIDEIAFQTNILSLNAAVEAARAGQHGKGFAVVAEEVRNLASRSAEAAKETAELIETSIAKVKNGITIAASTADALNNICEGVSNAASFIGDISVASNEQASAIVQINKGIEQVSMVIQTNSATAEESAAASEELSGQAGLLKQMVERFELKDEFINSTYNHLNLSLSDSARSDKVKTDKQKAKSKKAVSDNEFGKY